MSSVAFRLTIYQANGTTPDLTMTSIRSGTNPYIVGVPSGDGQEVDLLTGTVRSGAYNIEVADVVTGSDGTGTVRLVTNKLEDASFRQQLLSRRAKLEMSRNNGSTWSVWIFGYLTGLRQIDAITYGFTVSDSRRIEATHTAFTWSADPNAATDEQREFPNRGCLVGGPTLQSFGPIKATGGWEYAWQEVQGRIVALNFVAAYNPPSWARNSTIDVLPYFNAIRPFFQMLPPIANLTGANFQQIRERQFVYGSASVQAIITAGSSVWKGTVRGAHTPPSPSQNGQGPSTVPNFGNMNFMYIDLDPGQSTSYPSANTFVRVQLIQKKISEVSPLYISEHPVDIVTKLYETVNIPFNASSAATVKALIGDDLRLALRITEPVVLGQFLAQSIFGPFGFSARTNASGEQEFFTTRIARATTPTISITDDDIVGDTPPPIFELEESSVVTSFRLTTKTLTPYISDLTEGLQAPPDGITETETTEVVQNADTSTYSTREVAYRFPGMLYNGSASSTAFTLSPEVVGSFFTGILAEGFDRFGRGAIASEVQVLATSSAASLQVGDEVLIDVGYYPNKNYRIGESSVGSRIAQIVRRTEAPEGPIFKLIDSGVNAQPTSPTFTLAKDAGDPRRVAAVTVTNASTLNAAGVTLAVQYQVSATTPTKTGTLYTRFLPGTIPTVAFNLPAVLPGSRVWVRMRTERTEYRASAWTAWTDVALDAWVAPASLTVGTTTANSIALSWSLGSPTANTIDPLDVFAYAGASAPADWTNYRVGSLANGSTSITVRNLDPSTQYTFGVAFKDEGSGAYSSFATATATTNAVNTVSCPAAPKMKVYTSFPDAGTSTGVALAIGAVEGYNIVVQRAPDSSGSPGTWADIALLAPLTPIFVDPLPSDGLTRWYRVFYRLSGFLDGTPGTARSATPIAIPDELVGQNASIISGGATLTFGNYLVGTPDSFYDGATSQSVAVDATPNSTANKVVARDGSGNFAANTITATLNGPAPAGQLTGDTLAANVITSSLTTVGTIGTGTWQGTSVGKNYGGTGLTSSAFTGITNERVFAYDGGSGAFFLAPSGSNGQALVYTAGALAWGNPAPGPHVLASTTGLGAEHTVSGLTSGMILQATGATTARFQTPSIPASSVTAGSFGGNSYTFTNDLTVSGTLTASLPYSSITGKPSYFPADLTSVNGTLGTANGGTANSSWPAANSGEYVVIYDSVTGAERLEAGPQGTTGQALITSGGALTWGNPAPGSHVLATTTGLGAEHTVSGLTAGQILQATGATTARFQTPSIPASSVTAGTFSGTSYTITNDLTVSGTLTASLPFSSITGTPTTLAGYGITDALSNSTSSTQSGYFGDIFLWDDATPSHYLQITNSANLTAARTLSINVNDASRTVSLSGNLTVSGNADISGTSSGTNTGDQTITLTGAVTGTGTGSFATTYAGTVPINKGGTNATTYTVSGTGTRALVYSITNGAFEAVAAGSSGQFLQSAGTTGDITWATPPTFTSSAAGYAPASGGGTSNFLRADGTWAVPSVGSVSANNVTAGTFSGATYTFSNSVTFTSGVRVANGETYKILNSGGTAIDVLSATTLGAGVINSSLTSVGTLTSLTVSGDLTVDTSTLKVDSTNNRVGVNTASPGATFEVYNGDIWLNAASESVNPEIRFIDGGGIGVAGLKIRYGNNDGNAYFEHMWDVPSSGFYFRNRVNGTTLNTLTMINGLVGIDNTSPIAPLSFANSVGNKIDLYHSTIGSGDRYGFQVQSSELRIHSGASGAATGGITFGKSTTTTFTEYMRLTNNGRLGIMTSSPNVELEVAGLARFTGTGGFSIGEDAAQNRIRTISGSRFAFYNSSDVLTGLAIRSLGVGATYGTIATPTNGVIIEGDVGIGTSSPGYKLSVAGTIHSSTGGFRFPDGTTQTTAFSGTNTQWTTSGTSIYYNTGNVGIGTASPSTQLHIKNSGIAYQQIEAGATYAYLELKTPASNSGYLIKNLATGNSLLDKSLYLWNGDGPIQFVPSATIANSVTISTAGYLGIGLGATTNPTYPLHVVSSGGSTLLLHKTSGGGDGQLLMSTTFGSGNTFSLSPYITGVSNGGFSIRDVTNGVDRIVVQYSTGNVGIGTTSPSTKLHVAGGAIADTSLYIGTTSSYNGSTFEIRKNGIWDGPCITLYQTGTSGQAWSLFSTNSSFSQGAGKLLFYNGTGAGDVAVLDSAGNMGLGTMTPSYRLDIRGSSGWRALTSGGTVYGAVTYNGTDSGTLYLYNGETITAQIGTRSNELTYFNGGNVGIGTTSPGQKLDVKGNILANPGTGASEYQDIMVGGISGWSSGEAHGIEAVYSTASSPLTFARFDMHYDGSSGAGSFRWGKLYKSAQGTGYVMTLTATSTTTADLRVFGKITADNDAIIGDATGWASSRLQVGNSAVEPAAEFNGTGNTANQSPVYVWNNVESGSTYFISFYSDGQNNARTLRGYINYRRDIATMNLTTASDYRIKTVHGPYTKSGAIFDKLKVHEGTIHGETARVPMVLAHELQEAYEPAVEGEKDAVNEDGTPKLQMVSYVAMIPVMLAEIKSLRERVAQLEMMS